MECYDLTDGGCCLAVDANSSCLFNCSGAERPLPEANYTCSEGIIATSHRACMHDVQAEV